VKSFNLNYARLFDQVADQSERPGGIRNDIGPFFYCFRSPG
jgi:hypothetical protein